MLQSLYTSLTITVGFVILALPFRRKSG